MAGDGYIFMNLEKYKAKICYTASGILIHEGKVLLVKHKKVGIWLPPGGHIEKDELAHTAAEREFWEETGVKVKAISQVQIQDSDLTQYLPVPISVNLHWISRENYEHRLNDSQISEKDKKNWGKGCEQHYNFQFLVEPAGSLDYKQNIEETDGIAWFALDELADLEMTDDIRTEVKKAFKLIQK